MLIKLKRFVFLLISLFCAVVTRSQTINGDGIDPARYIGRDVSCFIDTTAQLTLLQVQEAYKIKQFRKGRTDILNLGNTSAAIWVHFSLKRTQKIANYLVVDYANIEQVDCYISWDSQWSHYKAGSLTDASNGVRSTSQYIFPINLPEDQETAGIWLRVKSRNIMLLPLQLARADNLYLIENSGNRVVELCFVGFLFALLIFHLFLYLTVRDPAYLYYCLYILSLGIYTIGYLSGHIYLLGDSIKNFVYNYPHIFFSIGFATSILITNRFYNIRSISLNLFRWTNILLGGLSGLLLLSAFGFKAQAAMGAQVFGLLVPLTLIITSVYAYCAARKAVVYLGAAWLTFVGAVIYYVLCLQGILTFHPYSPLILQSGVLLEFMLLALALGRRYQTILEQQRRVEADHFKLMQIHNNELEQEVSKRTENLKEVINQLKASDEVKNKLFSIIAHDLRTPFNSLLSILSTDVIDLLDEAELKMVLRSNSNHFQQLKIMLDNILHWARSQMEEVQINKEHFDIIKTTNFLATVYKPIVEAKEVSIQISSQTGSQFCIADKNHIRLVLRNLLDNAVKYTNPSSSILIEIDQVSDAVRFSIQNSFIESNNDGQKARTTGLGIKLCEDYLTRNGSSLKKEVLGNIIRFSFLLPSADLN
ncbi:7TM diverse intracellular signaling domain-containing protein [Niabella yanshanensis]|uniref:histidine kinase n=1 Tax=Niabella yanshanensis TaxID=577386 RepID=A0ABZ0W6A8_9BACT|nr:7TM diverse intracellular signaling domain-containing protein [Niabella yanshanensis]WQD38813.1 7TM diverse intracellular signaling domain-containing protein [Niabella yanshanensis]